MDICFHTQKGEFGFLSNFYKNHLIEIEGLVWPTTEHYYQAMKFPDHPEIREQIRNTSWAGRAKMLARKHYHLFDEQRFVSIKNMVMYRALVAKFTQHPGLREQLLATGSIRLVEHTEIDSYWGDSGDGSGMNMLGRMLMLLRQELGGQSYQDGQLETLLTTSQE